MELDETGFPQPTGETEELEADSLVLALGQEADLSLLEGVPGIEVDDGVVQVGPNMMTGHAGIFAGGDMVPAERTVTVGVGHGKKAARNIDGWLRGRRLRPAAQARAGELRHPQHLVLLGRAAHRPAAARGRAANLRLRGGRRRPRRVDNALFEARRCLSCGNCFSCDNCYGVCPDNAVIKLGEPGELYADRPRLLQGLRDMRRGVPLRRDRDGPRGDLIASRGGSDRRLLRSSR